VERRRDKKLMNPLVMEYNRFSNFERASFVWQRSNRQGYVNACEVKKKEKINAHGAQFKFVLAFLEKIYNLITIFNLR